jgi:hypothetical protein
MANRNFHGKPVALAPGQIAIISGKVAIGATGAVGTIAATGVSTITRTSAGLYVLTLADSYGTILDATFNVRKTAAADLKGQLVTITANTVTFRTIAVATETDPANGDDIYFTILAKVSGVAN